jgi:hypothetical protein
LYHTRRMHRVHQIDSGESWRSTTERLVLEFRLIHLSSHLATISSLLIIRNTQEKSICNLRSLRNAFPSRKTTNKITIWAWHSTSRRCFNSTFPFLWEPVIYWANGLNKHVNCSRRNTVLFSSAALISSWVAVRWRLENERRLNAGTFHVEPHRSGIVR